MSSRDPPVFTQECWDHRGVATVPSFHMGAGDTHWNCHSCVAGTLLIEPSP